MFHQKIIIMSRFGQEAANRSLESLLDMDQSKVQKPEIAIRPQKFVPGNGLEFNNLSYSVIKKQKRDGVWIKKEAYLLNDISGQAMRGQVMAIMGPSGAGKSTFLDALAGRIAQGSLEGSVRIDGKPVSHNFHTHGILCSPLCSQTVSRMGKQKIPADAFPSF